MRGRSGKVNLGRPGVGRQNKRRVLECVLTGAAAVVLRLMFLAPYPSGWDDVDFALALDRYDLSGMQPHFPGYPVYILAGHLFHGWTGDPFMALSLLSAVTGGLTVVPLWLLFRSWGSVGAARLTVWLYMIAPLPWIAGVQPTSDAMGSMLSAWFAYFVWLSAARKGQGTGSGELADDERRRFAAFTAAGAILGLLLGVRISYVPLAVLWIWTVIRMLQDRNIFPGNKFKGVAYSAGAAAAVCTAWFTALVISEGGLAPFLQLAFSFTEGHFSDWGGTYHGDSSAAARAELFLFRQIGAAGLGTLWYGADGLRWLPTLMSGLGIAGAAVGIFARLRRTRIPCTRIQFLLVWIVPYMLWAFFAQNIEKPRHILPLLPPLLYTLVWGLDRIVSYAAAWGNILRRRIFTQSIMFAAIGFVWLSGTLFVSYPLLLEAHTRLSPMMQLANAVKRDIPAQQSLIFTWEEKRVISYVSPEHTIIRLRHWEDLRKEVLQYGQQPMRIYATNALVNGLDRPAQNLFREQMVFQGSSWVYPTYHTIVLYEGKESLLDALREGKEE